ncbi:MAG: HAMP domain-containing histidine kinase [Phycisphaeraceae bacterium]|nr:HAMP domain-containing histidine kinase [Phycisphaerales bacterium]MCB9860406.1 HAMP domain-containing histidine kinase [Phycisphaeraceae bacterium]
MRIRWKFAILLAILLTALVASVGTAVFSIAVFHRELEQPMASIQRIMTELNRIKRSVQEQYDLLGSPNGLHEDSAPVPDGAILDMPWTVEQRNQRAMDVGIMRDRVASSIEILETIPDYRVWLGSRVTDSIDRLADEAHAGVVSWRDMNTSGGLEAARAAMYNSHELIEAVESRILETAGKELELANLLRSRIFFILAVSTLAVLGSVLYATVLVRRWIIAPVGRIRTATQRIAKGDFSHRIETVGSDEIAELGHEVNHMSEMIVKMQEERIEQERLAAFGEMTRTIVHNLRNPLAGIRSIAELTQSELHEADPELASGQQRIVSTVDRFESWLTSLLRGSRPMELNPEPFDPQELFLRLKQSLDASARGAHINLIFESSPDVPVVTGDPNQIEQALIAFIANAIEVSPAGTNVRVGVDMLSETMQSTQCVQFWVEDQGSGVAPELQQKIFEPYFTTKQTGTGIGLALTKRVAQSHGGSVAVENSSSEVKRRFGARFLLTIPHISRISAG